MSSLKILPSSLHTTGTRLSELDDIDGTHSLKETSLVFALHIFFQGYSYAIKAYPTRGSTGRGLLRNELLEIV